MQETSWSLIGRAADADPAALSAIIGLYQQPLMGYLIGVRAVDPQEAEDIVHDFLVAKVLNTTWLAKADKERGRFRNYMLRSMQNFLKDRNRRARNPVAGAAPIDVLSPADEPVSHDETEAFDLAWSETVINRALEATKEECKSKGQEIFWYLFYLRILGPATSREPPKSLEDCAVLTNFKSPSHVSNAVLTVERRLQRHARTYIASYCPEDQVDEEVHHLVASLGQNDVLWAQISEQAKGLTAGMTVFGDFVELFGRLDSTTHADSSRADADRRELLAAELARRPSGATDNIGNILSDGASRQDLVLVKDLAKSWIVEFDDGTAHDVWLVVYVASVWSAAVSLPAKITTLSWDQIEKLRNDCKTQTWLSRDMRHLLNQNAELG